MKSKSYVISVSEFGRAIGKLARRMRAAAAAQGLSVTEFSVLTHIGKHGPATTADLARAEAVKPQSMGAVVADLEKRGIVMRKPHPTDGRRVYIALTAKGVKMREDARSLRRNWLTEAVAQLDDDERELLFRATKVIKQIADL
jgi:DNA-binding MarR family transcriptional regulator